jgi:hypothetical protein
MPEIPELFGSPSRQYSSTTAPDAAKFAGAGTNIVDKIVTSNQPAKDATASRLGQAAGNKGLLNLSFLIFVFRHSLAVDQQTQSKSLLEVTSFFFPGD